MKHAGAVILVLAVLAAAGAAAAQAKPGEVPFYLKDRGPGVPTSMFGTYVQKGEWIVYPFFEYYLDNNYEYSPNEFGLGLDQDYRGRYRESEWLMFLAYGLSDRLAVEVEAALTRGRPTSAIASNPTLFSNCGRIARRPQLSEKRTPKGAS